MISTQLEAAQSDRGEDRIAQLSLPGRNIFVVADGAGGTSGGAAAADFICAQALEQAPDASTDWTMWLSRLDEKMTKENQIGQAAAIIVEVQKNNVILGASVGDCEAWLFPKSTTSQNLTCCQFRKPLLGTGISTPIGFKTKIASGTLLIATDGLWKYMNRAQITQIVMTTRPLDTASSMLVDGVRLKNGGLQDDIGIVMYEIG